jgi:hypothetical protein
MSEGQNTVDIKRLILQSIEGYQHIWHDKNATEKGQENS